jgi:hypothetical protein
MRTTATGIWWCIRMNREQILAMKPGPELNALVAEKVMGWKTNWLKTDWWEEINPNTHHHKGLVKDFNPSEDMSAAWEVVEKMKQKYFCEIAMSETEDGNWHWMARFILVLTEPYTVKTFRVVSPTAPEAICKAALWAVTEP